jgi:hypothetical protein
VTLDLDALADRVAARLRPVLAVREASPVNASAATMMRRKDYARRVSLSVRALDARLPVDAYAGEGRLKRVIVAKADAALLANAPAAETKDTPSDPVERLARAPARKAAR